MPKESYAFASSIDAASTDVSDRNSRPAGNHSGGLVSFVRGAKWYHTIDFGVVGDGSALHSKGVYNHSPFLDRYGFPQSLAGRSVLDVGASDGFFSFDFERRGAEAVLALDSNKWDGSPAISAALSRQDAYAAKYQTNYQTNLKFLPELRQAGADSLNPIVVAKTILGSRVDYRRGSIYELEKLGATFDFVFCGDLIEHLKNPIEAVGQLRRVCKGTCVVSLSSAEPDSWGRIALRRLLRLEDRQLSFWGDSGGSFFHFSPGAFKRLLKSCGFSTVRVVSQFPLPNLATGEANWHVIYHCESK